MARKVIVRSSGVPAVAPAITPQIVSAAEIVAVRTVRTYLQALVGFLILGVAAGAIPFVDNPIAATDFVGKLGAAASLAVAPAVLALIQNIIEMTANVDKTTPRLRA